MLIKVNLPAHSDELQDWLSDMEDYKFERGDNIELYCSETDTIA
jgi:hypothetical protein